MVFLQKSPISFINSDLFKSPNCCVIGVVFLMIITIWPPCALGKLLKE